MRPRALDLFCGAGGATKGLQLAGFHVTGVDLRAQPRYCGDVFHQADALTFPLDGFPLDGFDFIWASPPCQAFTQATISQRESGKTYPDLIAPARYRLERTGRPFVIENVMEAPLQNAIMLCGSMFGLRTWRHRLFELSAHFQHFPMLPPCNHTGIGVSVAGHGTPSWVRARMGGKGFSIEDMRAALGIDWMDRNSLSLAIPPAYSQFIGEQAMQVIHPGNVERTDTERSERAG